MYLSYAALATEYCKDKRTIQRRVAEMKEYPKYYARYITRDSQTRIDEDAFNHYCVNKPYLKHGVKVPSVTEWKRGKA